MENGKNWLYNSSLTVRIDKKLKDRIQKEAQSRDMTVSEYFRTFYEGAELSNSFLALLPNEHRAFIEKHVSQEELRTGKGRHEIITRLISQWVQYALDNGFFIEFKRR